MFCCNVAAELSGFRQTRANAQNAGNPGDYWARGLQQNVSEHRLKLSAVITNQLLCQLSYAGNRDGWKYAFRSHLVQHREES